LHVESVLPPILRLVQYLKQLTQVHSEVSAVLASALLDVLAKDVFIKDAGVIGKKAKQNAD
jgi:hypothetical protein